MTVTPSGTTDAGGMIAPAPMRQRLPIFTRSHTVALAPIKHSSPISTSPQIVAAGEMVLYDPTTHRVIVAE